MARKANRATRIIEVFNGFEKERGQRCRTCSDPEWTEAIRTTLDSMISGDIPITTSPNRIFEAISEHHERLGIRRYPYSFYTFRNHLKGHERERWREIQAIRDGRGS